jgi:hypothetical protein
VTDGDAVPGGIGHRQHNGFAVMAERGSHSLGSSGTAPNRGGQAAAIDE